VIRIHLPDHDVNIRIGRDQCLKLSVDRNGVAAGLGPQNGENSNSFHRPARVCVEDSACQYRRLLLQLDGNLLGGLLAEQLNFLRAEIQRLIELRGRIGITVFLFPGINLIDSVPELSAEVKPSRKIGPGY